jgi:hypothetical protein
VKMLSHLVAGPAESKTSPFLRRSGSSKRQCLHSVVIVSPGLSQSWGFLP